MNNKMKRSIRSKTRVTYGLMSILQDDIDNLRIEANDHNLGSIDLYVRDVRETLQKMIDVVIEIEYILYLDNLEDSRE